MGIINLKKKRSLFAIAFLCLIVLVGITMAYFTSTSVLENIFNAGIYKTVTTEVFTSPTNWTPGDETPKTITTKNEGTIPVRVRVGLEENWTSKNDNDLNTHFYNEITGYYDDVAIINLDNVSDWVKLSDGYYYYLNELAPGESTSSLIRSVTFNPDVPSDVSCTSSNGVYTCESTGDGYDAATYTLSIRIETVQANKYKEIWDTAPIMYDYVGNNPCTYNGELVSGAEYTNGQYTYRYMKQSEFIERFSIFEIADIEDVVGWSVGLTDYESTDPITTPLCSSINNKPIVSMNSLFALSNSSSLDFSSFDTSNVIDMSHMFSSGQAASLNLSSFNTSKVTDMSYMFYGSKATSIDFSSFDTSNVIDMSHMFSSAQAASLNLSSFNTSKVRNMSYMFSSSQATSLNLSGFDTSNVNNMSYMFSGSQLTTLDLTGFVTSKVSNMSWMFANSNVTSLNLSSFNTSSVVFMEYMFYNSNVTSLNLGSFNTSKVIDMSHMFSSSKATSIDLSSFNTSKVTDMSWMFSSSQATTLNLSNFNTSDVRDMSYMFSGSKATTLNLSNFNTSKVYDMCGMFNGSAATTINVLSFNTARVDDFSLMFQNCKATTLDLSSFDIDEDADVEDMFNGAITTVGYCKNQNACNILNSSSNLPNQLEFVIKN